MCRSTAGIRAWGAKPVNRTGPASGRAWASAARRPGPSPTISRQAGPRSRGYQAPLRELRFATVGREIYFQHPDGIWEGDLRPDQVVIYEVILLDPLRLRIDSAARRSAGDAGRVEKRRGVHASAPVFAGTRIRVATVQRYLQQGYLTDAILEAFPDLKVEDVDEARRQLAAAS
jgi:uncharacterized protein (DUF433 family)